MTGRKRGRVPMNSYERELNRDAMKFGALAFLLVFSLGLIDVADKYITLHTQCSQAGGHVITANMTSTCVPFPEAQP